MAFNRLREFIDSNNIEVHIYKNRVYIVNYISILSFNSNKIIIKYKDGIITINGEDLIISKLEKYEIMICGTILGVVYE